MHSFIEEVIYQATIMSWARDEVLGIQKRMTPCPSSINSHFREKHRLVNNMVYSVIEQKMVPALREN